MRLSSTSRGRECVAPRINRSRHANRCAPRACIKRAGSIHVRRDATLKSDPILRNAAYLLVCCRSRGTNVHDNRPFERFSFERTGVDSFGDLSYLLQQSYEVEFGRAVRIAHRQEWPSVWGGRSTQGAAQSWMRSVKSTELLLYTREQYRAIAKPLGIWAESQRATHNGTITLPTEGGGLLVLADRRRCPYLDSQERLGPSPLARPISAVAGASCTSACRDAGGKCDAATLEWGNRCEVMQAHFACEAGCGHQVGPELPAYASSPSLDTYQQCLVSDIAVSQCDAKYTKTRRLCFCAF
jgi:hypothetical protein